MKFVHIADMHFDAPFTSLAKKNLSGQRRLEQRQVWRKVIQYIQENQIPYLFIAGDLYEQEYTVKSTIEFIHSQFEQIPNTKVIITPGNHDPLLPNSYYQQFNWSKNVSIFSKQIQKIEDEDIVIYGFGFSEFYLTTNQLQQIPPLNKQKINIFITHGAVDASTVEERNYNPMAKKELMELGFDYIALGHIHKPMYQGEIAPDIIYPGSLISLGFDEPGKHGMVVGEIKETKEVILKFLPLDEKEFKEIAIDVTLVRSKEELIEILNSIELDTKAYYKIKLIGRRKFSIELSQIISQIQQNTILKLKDETMLEIDLEKIAKQNNLKGIFVKNMLQKMERASTKEEKERIRQALEIGIEAIEA